MARASSGVTVRRAGNRSRWRVRPTGTTAVVRTAGCSGASSRTDRSRCGPSFQSGQSTICACMRDARARQALHDAACRSRLHPRLAEQTVPQVGVGRVHRDVQRRQPLLLDAGELRLREVGQRDVVPVQERQPEVVVLDVEALAHPARQLVDEAEHALVGAGGDLATAWGAGARARGRAPPVEGRRGGRCPRARRRAQRRASLPWKWKSITSRSGAPLMATMRSPGRRPARPPRVSADGPPRPPRGPPGHRRRPPRATPLAPPGHSGGRVELLEALHQVLQPGADGEDGGHPGEDSRHRGEETRRSSIAASTVAICIAVEVLPTQRRRGVHGAAGRRGSRARPRSG